MVGGGLAGLTETRARRAVGRRVLLVEAEAALGGRARFQPAMAEALAEPDAGPHLLATLCVGLYEEARQALLFGPDGPTLLAFDELVVATGAYDRLPGFAGWRALCNRRFRAKAVLLRMLQRRGWRL